MNNLKKSIIATIIVIGILAITGVYYWILFSQALGYIVPVIMTAIISVILTLFVYNLTLKIKPKSPESQKSEKEEPKLEKEDDYIDVYGLNKTKTSKVKVSDKKVSKNNDYSDIKTV